MLFRSVVSRETYDRLSGMGNSLVEFMRHSPLYGLDDVEFERNRSGTRELEF